MNKKIAIIAFLVLAAAAGGYWYWSAKKPAPSPEPVAGTSDALSDKAAQGTLPAVGEALDPLGDKPDLNPADKTNPFTSVKTNPFE